jgi:2-polyprenyl-3-methyl-5-hydroxy-6-metoxy-1,4-benzoquinol methylase
VLDEDELEAELLMFCPDWAEREFDPFGWQLETRPTGRTRLGDQPQ